MLFDVTKKDFKRKSCSTGMKKDLSLETNRVLTYSLCFNKTTSQNTFIVAIEDGIIREEKLFLVT